MNCLHITSFFNIVAGIVQTFIKPWNQLLYPRVIEVCRLPFEPRHDFFLHLIIVVLPLSNEHGSQVKDQGRRQCCHNKHKKLPYRPTRDVSLLSGHASYCYRSRGSVVSVVTGLWLNAWWFVFRSLAGGSNFSVYTAFTPLLGPPDLIF